MARQNQISLPRQGLLHKEGGKMKKLISLALIAFLYNSIIGCGPVMTSGTPAIKNETVMNQIKTNVTDKNTVYQLLGSPMSAHNLPSGEVWNYHYGEVNRKFKLIGWGGLFDSTIDSQNSMVQIIFDNNGIVKNVVGLPIKSANQQYSNLKIEFQEAKQQKSQGSFLPKVEPTKGEEPSSSLPSVGIKLPKYDSGGDGIIIKGVYPGSPAAKAGLKANDKIVERNGQAINTLEELQSLPRLQLGETVKYKIIRNGKEIVFTMNTVPFGSFSK